jgi:hypothetical protein
MLRNSTVRRQGRGRSRLLATALAIGLGLVLATPAAQAEPTTAPPTLTPTLIPGATPNTSEKLVARITAEMKVDCAGMSGEALGNAIELKQCPAPGEAGTNNTTVGDCGASWIEVYDDVLNDGLGRVNYGMSSYLGTMVYRSLVISYAFTTQDQGIVSGAFGDSGIMLSASYSADALATSPLPSILSVIMTGGVTLLTGTKCVIIPPRSIARIS